ncbi:MAG TPA: hypothetical protein VN677_09340, partial [Gemmatimonadaceae bacterium]|nr:hypothetical protein [Gemmatimonadaceae bacterium]
MTSRRPRTTTLACLLLLLIWAPAYAQAHPRPDSLFSGYSAVSPHWPHIRTMMTDFFGKWAPNERSWAAGHYDYVM